MNGEVLGRKLKEARLAKKMTQSDVVGNYITRNMLSQIESGVAFPSIRTLEYLSGVLEVPMSELVANEDESAADAAVRETIICPHCGIKFEKD
jgi:transcriptional regulator with XRE-family HTH domain